MEGMQPGVFVKNLARMVIIILLIQFVRLNI